MALIVPTSPMIGIDIGTNYVSASVYRQGKLERIPNRYGNYLTPSYVAFTEEYGRLVGEDAKKQETINPKTTIFGVKSLIGLKWSDVPIKMISSDYAERFPFSLVKDGEFPKLLLEENGKAVIYRPAEIISALLEAVKQDAERYLKMPVKDAVITVPAYFTYLQRHLISEAATVAELNAYRIISEPEAALLAYAYKYYGVSDQENVLIVDIGGAGLNTGVALIDDGHADIKAVAGKRNCGGQAMVNRMLAYFAQEFRRKHKKNLNKDLNALTRLRVACEKAMIKLSSSETAWIEIDQLFEGIDFYSIIGQQRFDNMVRDDLVKTCLDTLQTLLRDAKIAKGKINNVLLIGGCSHIPEIRKTLGQFFETREITFNESLANGLVADGAALQAGIMTGKLENLLLHSIVPISLGLKLPSSYGMEMTTIIPRNFTVPRKVCQTVEMPSDEHAPNSVSVEIYQGERVHLFLEENDILGKVTLRNIRMKRDATGKSQAKVDVTFDIDRGNKLVVTVNHAETESSVTFDVSAELELLRREDVEIMKTNAKTFRNKSKQGELKLAKDNLEAFCFNLESTLTNENHWKVKLTEEVRNEILDKCGDVRIWICENGSKAEKSILQQKLEEVKAFCKTKNATFLV